MLRDRNAQAFFITNPVHIFYCTGFVGLVPTERESTLLVTVEDIFLYVPAMYETQARACSTVQGGLVQLSVARERDGLLKLFAADVAQHSSILFESNNLSVAEWKRMENYAQLRLVPEDGFLENMRLLKDQQELEVLRTAVRIGDEVFQDTVHFLQRNNYTQLFEFDIAQMLLTFGRKRGADSFSFDPIVAVGSGSAEPHYFTGAKKLQKGLPLLLDFGFRYKGYCSDLTRTVYLGKASERFRQMYGFVLASNQVGISSCKSHVTTRSVYDAANRVFQEQRLEKHFIHGLGHGIGLQVHEPPYARADMDTVLAPGMTLTIEPGLYFEKEFGIRIEDLTVITSNGCEVLSTRSEKHLIEII